MSEPIKKTNRKTPESYIPKKPEIFGMVKDAMKNGQSMNLPTECIITPKEKIAEFSGEKWPFSNVEPAVYGALGLLYGRTERRDDAGALINDDIEYAIHNVLTGHAFGLFYCWPDDSFSMAAYGFTSCRLEMGDYSEDEIVTVIKDQNYRGNAVHIDEGNGRYDYLIWGYKDNGNILLGYRFEHGNDMVNCSFDFDNPSEFISLSQIFKNAALFKRNGEKLGGITIIQTNGERLDREVIYRQALAEGYRMLTQIEPPSAMDFERVHFGYGKAIYDEWVRQIEQAEAENREEFFDTSPIFPHFIALYENRLQILRFLKHWNEQINNGHLQKAIELCEKLKSISGEASTLTMDGEWNPMRKSPNSEKRAFALDALKKCRALELEIAEQIKIFIDSPESYVPKKPEILGMAKTAINSIAQETKGTTEMEYRIEVKESFQIMGISGYEYENADRNSELTGLWVQFTESYDKRLMNHNGECMYTPPYYQIGACNEKYVDGKMKMTIGAEYKGTMIEGMSLETVAAATYAVFSFPYPAGYSKYMDAAAKISKWFPSSGYKLDEKNYRLEVYQTVKDGHWEIWMPVKPS